MIRAIANKRLDLSDGEFSYYKEILREIGADDFRGLFDTDKNGLIISIAPPVERSIPMLVLFFVLNVMMNQRVRMLNSEAKSLRLAVGEDRINTLESRVEELEKLIQNGDRSHEQNI